KPGIATSRGEITWAGYLQSFWMDQYGGLREDTNRNRRFDEDQDKVLAFKFDSDAGETRASRFGPQHAGKDGIYDGTIEPEEIVDVEEVVPLWEAGKVLAGRDIGMYPRNIFTNLDNGSTAGRVDFTTNNRGTLKPFLGLEDNATWNYLGAHGGEDVRANNLICFINGVAEDDFSLFGGYMGTPDTVNVRSRTMDDGRLWRLGDIVNSTPVSISRPVSNYGRIYGDESYKDYYMKYRNRETVVYVGGNDGMLHAFTSGVYSSDNKTFVSVQDMPGYLADIPDRMPVGNLETDGQHLGQEMWAYIPQCLLPHLKWLPSPEYTHVPYVDVTPRVFDVQIFDPSDETHPGGWGTVLVCGVGMGGKRISAGGRSFVSSYFAIDVTNPRDPRLLWERTFDQLGFSVNAAGILKVKDNWFLALGSGPSDYDGTSSHKGHVYIVDVLTGGDVYYRDFETEDAHAVMSSPLALDMKLNYNVDAVYVGAACGAGSTKGAVYKITVKQNNPEFDHVSDDYIAVPSGWDPMAKLFDSDRPISGQLSLGYGREDNIWLFFGTGRFLTDADRTNGDVNYLYGIKDPFFNPDRGEQSQLHYYHQYGTSGLVARDSLLYANPYTVKKDGTVKNNGGVSGIGTWEKLLEEAREGTYDGMNTYNGWFRQLSGCAPSERFVGMATVSHGTVLFPTLVPNDDICGFGGSGRLYLLYYETGTGFPSPSCTGDDDDDDDEEVPPPWLPLPNPPPPRLPKKGDKAYGKFGEVILFRDAFEVHSKPIYWKGE
ncbi:MAG: hypothetical protein GY868_14740, partial [Deltaproteobacteria bacterium]|nr:hypothetical protein [Deltaproteobacteria bacterium]